MQYIVLRHHQIVSQFSVFADAWLYAYLSDIFSEIIASDGEAWIINPGSQSIN